jgi:hypothetical protein
MAADAYLFERQQMADIEVRTASHDDIDFIARLAPPEDEELTSQARLTVEGASTADNSAIFIAVGGDGRRRGYIHLFPERDDSEEEPRRYVMRVASIYNPEYDVLSGLFAEAYAWLEKRRGSPVLVLIHAEDESSAAFKAETINPSRPS